MKELIFEHLKEIEAAEKLISDKKDSIQNILDKIANDNRIHNVGDKVDVYIDEALVGQGCVGKVFIRFNMNVIKIYFGNSEKIIDKLIKEIHYEIFKFSKDGSVSKVHFSASYHSFQDLSTAKDPTDYITKTETK